MKRARLILWTTVAAGGAFLATLFALSTAKAQTKNYDDAQGGGSDF